MQGTRVPQKPVKKTSKQSESTVDVQAAKSTKLRTSNTPNQHATQSRGAELPQRLAQPQQFQAPNKPEQPKPSTPTDPVEESNEEEGTDSTIRSGPPAPDSPKAQPYHSLIFGPGISGFDKKAVDLLRQRLDIVHLFQGNGNELHDSSIVSEEKHITRRGDGYNLVVSVRIHGQDFANKITWTRSQQGQETYNQEINVLKTLREKPHWHVVFLVCHYTSPKNESCLILSPLAGGNLNEFLSQAPTPGRKNLVARWFGCLATALRHIHSQKIKHKDIKSMNILIHGDNIIITDLGISQRFDDKSETSGPSPGSLIYMAPEVHEEEPRGRTQDTWALLCCYIEMLAYLKGLTLPEFRRQFEERGIHFCSFYKNFKQVVEWLNSMRLKAADKYELALMEFILKSFKQEPNKRPYAPALVTGLQNIRTEGIQPYVGECCADLTGSFAYAKVSKETQAISFLTKLETLAKGSLLHFIVSAGQSMLRAQSPSEAAKAALEELLQEGKSKMVDSIRSAERKLLFIVAPRTCKTAEDYLTLCNSFIEFLADESVFREYKACLYNKARGEEEWPYSTAYFKTLDGEIRNRCRTYQWSALPGSNP